jgi:hypothetical protein
MNILVVTTINRPTKAISAFAKLGALKVVIVGDQKTPEASYKNEAALEFLSLAKQAESGFELYRHVPLNHYCRKNLGYLHAMRHGARVIAESDDDNLPYDTWPQEYYLGFQEKAETAVCPRVVNVYKFFSEDLIWPRGFPLTSIRTAESSRVEQHDASIMIWQGLADLDPDVDAIFRMVLGGQDILFKRRGSPLVLANGVYAPFNSQNTVWSSEAFMFLYLPMFVRFRFTDILRGYIAQRGIWELGGRLAFGNASVYQQRNSHDLLQDFIDEVDCYTRIDDIITSLDECSLAGDPGRDLEAMYSSLANIGVVEDRELQAVQAWIADVEGLTK